jgi:hypothetical protein
MLDSSEADQKNNWSTSYQGGQAQGMVLLPDNSGAPETEFIPRIVKRI